MNKRNMYLACAGSAATLMIAAVGVGTVQAQSAAPAAAVSAPSALVRLQQVQRKPMHASLLAYGDVLPGRLQSISSAVAAQVQRLDIVQGQSVKKGQILAVLDADPLVRLAYEQAKTAQQQAQAELQRVGALAKLQLATQSQVDVASKASLDANAALAAQRALGGATGLQTIKAPADGMIVALNVNQGDRVQAAAPIMQLGLSDQLKVMLGIDPADRAKLSKGAAVTLTPLNDSHHSIHARVADIQTLIDPKTQLINVLVNLPSSAELAPGARVRAEIALAVQDAFELPRQAVLRDADGSYVFQQVRQHAHRVAVQQVTDGQRTVGVTGIIDPALPVVVSGNYELHEGMLLRESH